MGGVSRAAPANKQEVLVLDPRGTGETQDKQISRKAEVPETFGNIFFQTGLRRGEPEKASGEECLRQIDKTRQKRAASGEE